MLQRPDARPGALIRPAPPPEAAATPWRHRLHTIIFEADTPDRIVHLIRRLRATEARRYTKVEIPFVSGLRKDVVTAIRDLP